MSAIVLILLAIVIFVVAYNTYGKYLAKAWGLSSQNETPAHTMEDGVDYVPAKTPILLGHHFSSIAGAGPINGPIQAALFGWVPVFLWIVIGGIFFGAVQDFGSIFVSIRHQGKSLGEVIAKSLTIFFISIFIFFRCFKKGYGSCLPQNFTTTTALSRLLFLPDLPTEKQSDKDWKRWIKLPPKP